MDDGTGLSPLTPVASFSPGIGEPPPARGAAREIELSESPANRLVWLARLIARLGQIAFWLVIAALALPAFFIARRSFKAGFGAAMCFLFQRLGATFIKIGQIVSTRPDIFSPELTAPLVRLQDQVPPFRFSEVRRAIEEDFGRKLEDVFAEIAEAPIASASIAQVHRAVLRDAELPPSFQSPVVAIKVRRPAIVRRARLDEAILEFGARFLAIVPSFSLISPVDAVRQFCDAVNKQLDFRVEAENNHRFRKNFENDPHIVIPALVEQLCSDRVLTMEFIEGVKEDKIRAVGDDPEFIARKGTEAIVRMIFQHGFVHADLHPGNLLFLPGNRMAVFDLGLVGTLDEQNRRRFAFLCYYIVAGMGAEVARWLFEQADGKRLRDYVAYEREIVAAVAQFYDQPYENMQLTGLIASVYDIVRRNRIRIEATFTVPNIAMMVIEGIARKIDPKLVLTREARPHLESALALAVAGPSAAGGAGTELAPSIPTAVAAGRYRVRRLLGEGVRKRVYLARDTRLDRDVALAFVRTEDLDDAGRERVLAESRAVAKLADHPRIVPVHDTGEDDGVPYIVSQYMAGGTLSGKLLRATEHRMPIAEVLRYADQIAQALEHAHAHGIIHRDVKPENVWLTEDGFAKLGDFGLARVVGRADGSLDGLTVGTALYMSPEQALGRRVDQRSDLYSLGATLYELATGRPPFEGESVAEVISRHIGANPESPSRRNPLIPPALDAAILKLLAKSPENRFGSAAEVRKHLRDLAIERAATPAPSDVGESLADDSVAPESTAFIGREQEIGRLRKNLEEALAGRGRLTLLVGEPGIGKTRTATQLATYAATRGARVLVGRCHEGEGAPAFWPWVQILRSFLEGRDGVRVETELGSGASLLAQIVPEIRDVVPDLPPLPALEGDAARFRLFDAIAGFFVRAAEAKPLVLHLDDLHWADKPSLLLLQFVARQMGSARLLIVGTYRDVDVQHGHPLADVLPSLRRERVFERVLLRGLPEEDVRALVEGLAGEEVPESFVRAIHRETEGNPFFIEETLRHLVEEKIVSRDGGRWTSAANVEEMGLPEGIREVVGRRLARLSEPCRRVLTIASALGREFDSRVLQEVAGMVVVDVPKLLDEAAAARIVEEEKGSHARFRFSHALLRETIHAELRSGERAELHRRIAATLEELYAAELEAHLPELAHHFLESAQPGDVDQALRYATLGAERAARGLAYEEAATLYQRALKVLEMAGGADPRRRCDLLLGLGRVQWDSGEFARSKQTVRDAIDLAASAGTPEQLARATLAHSGRFFENTAGQVDAVQIELLDRALARLPRTDDPLRALLLGRLAAALAFSKRRSECADHAAEALAIARRLGDGAVLCGVLTTTAWALAGPDNVDDRLAMLDEAIRLAEELDDERLAAVPTGLRHLVLLAKGDIEAAEAALERFESRRSIYGAYTSWLADVLRAGLAIAQRPASEAEESIQRALRNRGENQLAMVAAVSQRFLLLWQQGRLDEVDGTFREFFAGLRTFVHPYLGCASALLDAELGRRSAAQKAVDHYARNGFGDIQRDAFWAGCLSFLACAVEMLGDARSAATLYDLLLPYGDRVGILLGHYLGSISHYLGLLARTLSRLDDAARHFEAAVKMHERMPAMLARTQFEYARVLMMRARPEDRRTAISLLASAAEGARRLEMEKLATRALALKLEAEGVDVATSAGSSIDAVTASIEAKGLDVRRATAANGTVTLLFSDMEGSTEMTERLGDAAAHRVMQAHHGIIRGALRAHGGSEIDEQGDGFLLAFPKATEALRYAIAVQRALAAYRAEHAEEPIRVRMGLHTGEPIREGDRFFGKTVILAARIAAHAKGDEILVSSTVRSLTEPTSEFRFDGAERVTLKGLTGTHEVCGVVWDAAVPARRTLTARGSRRRRRDMDPAKHAV